MDRNIKIILICFIFISISVIISIWYKNFNIIKIENIDSLSLPEIYIYGDIPSSKKYVNGELEFYYNNKKYKAYIEMRLQGDSSLKWPKKNYMIKFYSDVERKKPLYFQFKNWEPQNEFCLKSNWVDHSHARNVVSSRLWKDIVQTRIENIPKELRKTTTLGTIDGFPVKVYSNDEYQGMYTWNLPKSEKLFNINIKNSNHAVIMANINSNKEYLETSANFRKLWNGNEEWVIEFGNDEDKIQNSINNLISCVKEMDDKDFKENIEKYLDIESAIDYYIFQYLICGVDGLGKNLMLITYDGSKWYCTAYDLDYTFGLHPKVFSMVPFNCRCPKDYQEENSLLWERIEKIYEDEIYKRYLELTSSVLSYENVEKEFRDFIVNISDELYKKDTEIYDIPNAQKSDVNQILDFYKNRLEYVDDRMKK